MKAKIMVQTWYSDITRVWYAAKTEQLHDAAWGKTRSEALAALASRLGITPDQIVEDET